MKNFSVTELQHGSSIARFAFVGGQLQKLNTKARFAAYSPAFYLVDFIIW